MRFLLATLLLTFIQSQNLQAGILLSEDFDGGTVGVQFTTSQPDAGSLAGNDYFGVFNENELGNGNSIFFNNTENNFYAAQDIDSAGGPNPFMMNWAGIDISTFNNLNLSFFIAEDDAISGEDWDSDTSFRVEVNIDGGGFFPIFAVEGTGGNTEPLVDTDFDGTGDGAAITNVFTQFNAPIGNGRALDIRFVMDNLTSSDEDIAFDRILLTGDAVPVPEPATCGIFAFLGGVVAFRKLRAGKQAE
ncbi:hypothetical protein Pla52o_11520 [Novipirellula galeiformis]|uniref:PEP-CTERM protein-sorting domain-containing protein n=1 Tax=Novipirellula galeiformis TaxID=2528004 RepID=A0A5C6CQ06_9BACT|nr:hypothetical protein [Novipirellula galeiformis]TWU24859.1 hypothetical protein Pla52o_11520 [Novipirellula galeiformis]